MLRVQDLWVRYGPVTALRGIDVELTAGKIACVLGPNGAGKTTLIRAISAQARPSAGSIRFRDREIHGLAPFEVVRRGIVQCPEGRRLFGSLTVEENLKLGATRRGLPLGRLREDLEFLFDLFPIVHERWRQKAGTLSGGEQQMVALARSVIGRPELLLLDEPALGLAPRMVKQLFELLPRIAERGTTLLLVEQNARAALSVAADAYLLRNGVIEALLPAPEMLRHLQRNDGYFGDAETDRAAVPTAADGRSGANVPERRSAL